MERLSCFCAVPRKTFERFFKPRLSVGVVVAPKRLFGRHEPIGRGAPTFAPSHKLRAQDGGLATVRTAFPAFLQNLRDRQMDLFFSSCGYDVLNQTDDHAPQDVI